MIQFELQWVTRLNFNHLLQWEGPTHGIKFLKLEKQVISNKVVER